MRRNSLNTLGVAGGHQVAFHQSMTTEHWAIDASHSWLHFWVRHLGLAKVRGQFSRWTGAIVLPEGDATRATVTVLVDASSLDTGVADRDAHLRSPDFFDVARHADITFTAARFEPHGGGAGRLFGHLTIKDTTRAVTVTVQRQGRALDPWGNERAAYSAHASIDRRDFGLVWNQTLDSGGVLVGDLVELDIEIEAVRQPAADAVRPHQGAASWSSA